MPVFSLFYYGSVARGDDGAGSDLDIGVIADAKNLSDIVERLREGLREPSEKLTFHPAVVGLNFTDVKTLERDADPWWSSVKSDAVALSGQRPDDAITHKGSDSG